MTEKQSMGEDFMNLAANADFDKISRIYSNRNKLVIKRKYSEMPTPFRMNGGSIDLDVDQHIVALNINNNRWDDDDDGQFVALDNYEMNPDEIKRLNHQLGQQALNTNDRFPRETKNERFPSETDGERPRRLTSLQVPQNSSLTPITVMSPAIYQEPKSNYCLRDEIIAITFQPEWEPETVVVFDAKEFQDTQNKRKVVSQFKIVTSSKTFK